MLGDVESHFDIYTDRVLCRGRLHDACLTATLLELSEPLELNEHRAEIGRAVPSSPISGGERP